MLAQNVVKFESESTKIYNVIQSWFKDLNKRNRDYENIKESKTQKAYETDIRLFFYLMRNKEKQRELESLTMRDIQITEDDFDEYVDLLCDLKNEDGSNKYVNKTINRKITSLKSIVRFFKKKKLIDTDISYLQNIKGQKEKKNHYGCFTTFEVTEMARLAYEEKFNGKIKRLLILTAFKTGLRIAELLSMKWGDFQVKGNEVYINGIGKGNKIYSVPITKDFYEELLTLDNGQERVFDIGDRRIGDMIQRFCEKLGLDYKKRNLVFHSIRKAFGTLVYEANGNDIEAARKALRHESIMTTQIYLGINDMQLQQTILNIDKVEADLYKRATLEELIQAIENSPSNIRCILNNQLYELLNKNN
jgi:integrase